MTKSTGKEKDGGHHYSGDEKLKDDEITTKRSKKKLKTEVEVREDNDDDDKDNLVLVKLALTAWEHFQNFIESSSSSQQQQQNSHEPDNGDGNNHNCCISSHVDDVDGGDMDELQEIIDILKPHVAPPPPQRSHDSMSLRVLMDDMIASWVVNIHKSGIVSLLPVLMSVSYCHLAMVRMDQYLEQQQQQQDRHHNCHDDDDDDWSEIQQLITGSLQYCPWNATMWSMAANFGRCTRTMNPTIVVQWYERAAQCAHQIRHHTLSQLLQEVIPNEAIVNTTESGTTVVNHDHHHNMSHDENESNDNDDDDENDDDAIRIKEWMEVLLLQQMAGVEWTSNDDDVNDGDDHTTDHHDRAKMSERATHKIDDHSKETSRSTDKSLVHGLDEEEEDEDGYFSFSAVEATARFMAAMLQSTCGHHHQALQHLKHFRLTHRLHPDVWNLSVPPTPTNIVIASNHTHRHHHDPMKMNEKEIANKNNNVVVGHDDGCHNNPLIIIPTCFGPNVVPPHLYQRLCQVFAPNSMYWKESNYHHRGYFSYFMKVTETRSPHNLIEDVIMTHLLPLAQQVLDQQQRQERTTNHTTTKGVNHPHIVGAEWWVHTRPIQANLGHNLHFDTDESLLDDTGRITHPIVSSVLYLTGNHNDKSNYSPAGPTIILNQTADSSHVAMECWRNIPKDNTFLVFPGNLLHGVLPCPGEQSAAGAAVTSTATAVISSTSNQQKHDEDDHQQHDRSSKKYRMNDQNHGHRDSLHDDDALALLTSWTESMPQMHRHVSSSTTNDDNDTDNSNFLRRTTPLHRLTFMVGFWTRHVPDQMKEQRLYGPCGSLPSATDHAMWMQEICQGYNNGNSNDFTATNRQNHTCSNYSNSIIRDSSETATILPPSGNGSNVIQHNHNIDSNIIQQHVVPMISPVWEEIKEEEQDDADPDPPLCIPRAIDHRFFVDDASECFRNSLFEKE